MCKVSQCDNKHLVSLTTLRNRTWAGLGNQRGGQKKGFSRRKNNWIETKSINLTSHNTKRYLLF